MTYKSLNPSEFDIYQITGYQNMHTQGTIFAVLDNSGKPHCILYIFLNLKYEHSWNVWYHWRLWKYQQTLSNFKSFVCQEYSSLEFLKKCVTKCLTPYFIYKQIWQVIKRLWIHMITMEIRIHGWQSKMNSSEHSSYKHVLMLYSL